MSESPSADESLKILGHAIVNFSVFENELKQHIWFMLGKDQGANLCVTADVDTRQLADLFHALFLYRTEYNESLKKRCKDLDDRIRPLIIERNRIVHSDKLVATLQSGEGFAFSLNISKKGNRGLTQSVVSDSGFAEQLKNFMLHIDKAYIEMDTLVDDARTMIVAHLADEQKHNVPNFPPT